jgi:hypothetical protein
LGSLLVAPVCFADEPPCLKEIPVNVVLPSAALARNMERELFVAKTRAGACPIISVAADVRPRRIVFVIDNAKSNSRAERRIEAKAVNSIIAAARPQDSFALLTGRGAWKEVRFGEPRAALLKVANEIETSAGRKTKPGGVLDAVYEACQWLGTTQSGDAIIMISNGIERPTGISYRKVRDALTAAGIRLFGLQLNSPVDGFMSSSLERLPSGGITMNTDIWANRESLDGLAAETGGFALLEDTDSSFREYRLTDDHLDLIGKRTIQFYKAVCEYYLVRVKVPQSDFVIDLSENARAKMPAAMLMYPRKNVACSGPSSTP